MTATIESTPVSTRDRILDHLAAHPEGSTVSDIVAATGISRSAVAKNLVAAENAALTVREGGVRNGAHRVPDTWFRPADTAPAPDPAHGGPVTADGAADPPPTTGAHEAPIETPPQLNSTGAPKARPGELRAMVLTHLQAHPGAEFTAGEISKVLTRSAGAIQNALDKLTASGDASQTCPAPRRYTTASAEAGDSGAET